MPNSQSTESKAVAVVVNDDLTQLKILAGLLRKAGLDVYPFDTAEAALSAMRPDSPPDLIVTDLYMPGIDGWRFCRLLRSPEYPAFNAVPILVVSSTFAGEEASRITAGLGADAFMSSPVNGKQFNDLVKALLQGEHARVRRNVLIAEANPEWADSLRLAFQHNGFEADTALTLEQANRLCGQKIYDVAVLECHLADGNGGPLLARFRAEQPDCVCIMITTDADPGLGLAWMRAGAVAFVRKPCTPEYLIELCTKARRERSLLRVQDLLEERTCELRRSEERLRSVLQITADGFWVVDASGKVTEVNDTFCRMTGYSRDELIGIPIGGIDSLETPADTAARMKRIIQIGSELFETRNRRRDGSEFDIEVSATYLDMDGGQFICLGRDITERKKIEQTLLMMAGMLDVAPCSITIHDSGGNFLYANRKTFEVHGYAPHEFMAINLHQLDAPESEALLEKRFRTIEENGEASFEVQHYKKDGSVFPLEVFAKKVVRDGQPAILSIATDITQRKKSEEALLHSEDLLQRSNQLLASILEHTHMLAAYLDPSFNFLWVNKAYAESGRYEASFFPGKNHFDLYPNEENKAIFQRVVETGEPSLVHARPFEFPDQPERGLTYWDWSLIPVKENTDRVTGLVFTLTEVTETIKQQEELRLQSLVLDQIKDHVTITDLDGVITYVNQAQVDTLGHPKTDLIGQSTLVYGENPEKGAAQREIVLATIRDGEWRGEVINYAMDGQEHVMDCRTRIVYGPNGRAVALCGIATDITARKRAEDALRFQHHLAVNLSQKLDLRESLDLCLASIIRISGMDSGGIYLKDKDSGALHLACHQGLSAKFVTAVATIGPDTQSARMIQPGKPIFTQYNDLTDDPDRREEGLRSLAVVPIIHEGNIIACVNVGSHTAKEVAPPARPLIEAVAAQMGGFIARALLHEELRESEAKIRTLVENLPDIVVRFDRTGRYRFVSDNVEGVTDIPAAAFIDKTPRELGFPAPLCQFWEDTIQQVFASGKPFETEFPCEGKNGAILFNWRLIPEFNRAGKLLSLLSIGRDITAHRKAENALHKSEERYRELVENANSIIIRMDNEGKVTFFNEFAQRFFGYPQDEIEGRNVVGTIVPETDSAGRDLRAMILDIVHHPEQYATNENENIRRDGTRAWISWTNKPLLDAQGNVREILCVGNDFTERKSLEAQLQQAQKMESVGRLAGGVAHDFNNMLQVILNHSAMALDTIEKTDPLHENLEEILKAAQRSADLTRQLLAFARRQTVTPKVLDLNETIAGMLKLLRRLLGENIDLTWIPGTVLWPVKIDPSQLDQLLANLCVNARDAIAGIGNITIETGNAAFDAEYCAIHPGAYAGEYARITISDNGKGMDKETLAHIFEPFFTTKGIGEGTGLGLATVYGVVKQNNGFINVYSEPGIGTTFKIFLPRHRDKLHQSSSQTIKEAVGGHETVLLVEDEPWILKGVTTILEKLGYRVLAAATPGEAIRLAEDHSGDICLLITDVVMPEMNGRELAKRLLALYPGIKRLFMSGYTADVIAHHGILDAGVHFIQKPFTRQALAAKLREILNGEPRTPS